MPSPPPSEEKRDYWEERAEQNADKVYQYGNRKAQLVTRWFGRATREMEKRVVDFYRSYADKEQITLPRAKAVMTDRSALTLTIQEAARLAQLHPDDSVTRQLLDKAYTARAISREEFLQMQLNVLASEVYGEYSGEIHQSLTEAFEESYYKGLFDYQQFIGFGSSFNRISTHQIEAAVTTAWKGKNYSERLWGDHRKSLARYLNRIVTNGFIQGSSGGQMRAELQKAMSTSAYEARRLIRTESCQVSNRASLLAYQEFGTEQFQFLATLDFKTSELCRSMDGKVFSVAKASPGVNMPPLHPFCRSTTVPYFPEDADDTRAARGADGVTYTVPADMTYREWHQQYVESDPAQALAERKLKHGRADAKQYSRYQDTLGKDASKTFDDFQNLKYTDTDSWKELSQQYRHTNYYNKHLTGEEKAAVSSYISGGSYDLNAKLRNDARLTADEQTLTRNLDAALEKLPVFAGEVTRSLKFYADGRESFIKQHSVSLEVPYCSYTSASVSGSYHDAPDALLKIISHTGRDIRSQNAKESEILFRRDTRFRLLEARLEDGVILLEMEEITDEQTAADH